jgi:hypothetical protein
VFRLTYFNHWSRLGRAVVGLRRNKLCASSLSFALTTDILRRNLLLVQDEPYGCLGNITDGEERLTVVLDLLLRDLLASGAPRVIEGESNVCYQLIENVDSMLRFTDRCCHYQMMDPDESSDGTVSGQPRDVFCFVDKPNKWLDTLDILLASLFVGMFIFGVLLLPSWLYSSAMDTHKYVIELNQVAKSRISVYLVAVNNLVLYKIVAAFNVYVLYLKKKQYATLISSQYPSFAGPKIYSCLFVWVLSQPILAIM